MLETPQSLNYQSVRMLRIGQSAGTAIMEALTDYQGASHRDEGIVEPL